MRRFNTITACACAAALTTLVVIVTVPAIADNAANAQTDDGLAACLRGQGLDGAPDGAGLKEWLGPRLERGDGIAKRALEKCAPKSAAGSGPSEQELRACLRGHGVQVPGGDGRDLKRWILQHGEEAAYRDALKACGMGPVAKPVPGGECGKPDGAPKPTTLKDPDYSHGQ